MKLQILMMLIGCVAPMSIGSCQEPKTNQFPFPPVFWAGDITPLAACRTVPPNLAEELKRWYQDFCSATTAVERSERLEKMPNLQPTGMAGLFPLLSELMANTDSAKFGAVHFYVAQRAAEQMAEAGAEAVPFAIKALQSKNPVEVHAGLWCAGSIIPVLQLRGKRNELPMVSSNLLPYVAMQVTNPVPEEEGIIAWPIAIPDEAKQLEQELRRYLPPEPAKK